MTLCYLYIYDGDYWGYSLFVAGGEIDWFNPMPDYFGEVDEAEFDRCKGNGSIVAKYFNVREDSTKNYLKVWIDDLMVVESAYEDDERGYEDWQFVDFMEKLGYQYPEGDGTQEQTYSVHTDFNNHTYKGTEIDMKPRKKPLKPTGRILLGIGLVFIIMFLGFTSLYATTKRQIEQYGIEVDAEISSRRKADGDQEHNVYVWYIYEGQTYEQRLNRYSSRMCEGEIMQISIDENNPSSILDKDGILIFVILFGIIGALLLSSGGCILYRSLRME